MDHCCSICGKAITESVYSYSTIHYGKALCWQHQRIDADQKRQGEAEQYPNEWSKVQERVKRIPLEDVKIPSIEETDIVKWIAEWRRFKHLDFTMDKGHFFLAGMNLDDFTKQLIRKAKETILIANPFLEMCYLTEALLDSAQSSTNIKIVTRYPGSKEKKRERAQRYCHLKLKKAKIQLRYDRQIHSKIIVVDNEVAVVSSMNFYSGSSGGSSKEAGIVSLDEAIVASTSQYINKLHEGADPFVADTHLFP